MTNDNNNNLNKKIKTTPYARALYRKHMNEYNLLLKAAIEGKRTVKNCFLCKASNDIVKFKTIQTGDEFIGGCNVCPVDVSIIKAACWDEEAGYQSSSYDIHNTGYSQEDIIKRIKSRKNRLIFLIKRHTDYYEQTTVPITHYKEGEELLVTKYS